MSSLEQNLQGGQYVVFRLAREQYGIAIGAVKEIILAQELTRLPAMPDFTDGLINLRGRIIPVINLRKRFGLPAAESAETNRTVVAEIGGLEAGLLVDDVVGVLRVPAGSVQPPPRVQTGGAALVRGVAQVEERLVILLDPSLILMETEQAVLQEQVQMTSSAGK
jgi:purine-binding chemotaxis protein CheW